MTRHDQVRLARLACERKAAEIGLRNQRGVHRLDGIAGVAFFLGVFLTLLWILSCFGSLTGDKYTHFFYLMGALGRSLRPCVIGLLVGIPAKLVAAYIFGLRLRNSPSKCKALSSNWSWNCCVGIAPRSAVKMIAADPARARLHS